MTVEVRGVAPDVVRPLRHSVLRQGAPLAESFYPADDLPDTVHLAALDDGEVIGAVTFFPELYEGRPAWRLRGMAVSKARRGSGIGSMLLAEVLNQLHGNRADLLWCNARTVALSFYTGHGFTIVGEEFVVAQGIPHYVAVLQLEPVSGSGVVRRAGWPRAEAYPPVVGIEESSNVTDTHEANDGFAGEDRDPA